MEAITLVRTGLGLETVGIEGMNIGTNVAIGDDGIGSVEFEDPVVPDTSPNESELEVSGVLSHAKLSRSVNGRIHSGVVDPLMVLGVISVVGSLSRTSSGSDKVVSLSSDEVFSSEVAVELLPVDIAVLNSRNDELNCFFF